MNTRELEEELAQVRERLGKLDPSSSAYTAGKIIERAILYSLGIKEREVKGPYEKP